MRTVRPLRPSVYCSVAPARPEKRLCHPSPSPRTPPSPCVTCVVPLRTTPLRPLYVRCSAPMQPLRLPRTPPVRPCCSLCVLCTAPVRPPMAPHALSLLCIPLLPSRWQDGGWVVHGTVFLGDDSSDIILLLAPATNPMHTSFMHRVCTVPETPFGCIVCESHLRGPCHLRVVYRGALGLGGGGWDKGAPGTQAALRNRTKHHTQTAAKPIRDVNIVS